MNSKEYTEAISREGIAYNEIVRLSDAHYQASREAITTSRHNLGNVCTSTALRSVFAEKAVNLLKEWYGSISIPSHVDDITKEALREAHLKLLRRTFEDACGEVMDWLKGEFGITAVQQSTEIADAVDRVDRNSNPINKEEVPAADETQVREFMEGLANGVNKHLFGHSNLSFLKVDPN